MFLHLDQLDHQRNHSLFIPMHVWTKITPYIFVDFCFKQILDLFISQNFKSCQKISASFLTLAWMIDPIKLRCLTLVIPNNSSIDEGNCYAPQFIIVLCNQFPLTFLSSEVICFMRPKIPTSTWNSWQHFFTSFCWQDKQFS